MKVTYVSWLNFFSNIYLFKIPSAKSNQYSSVIKKKGKYIISNERESDNKDGNNNEKIIFLIINYYHNKAFEMI